jgi:DNA-binding beta-propeller fold protein YncE
MIVLFFTRGCRMRLRDLAFAGLFSLYLFPRTLAAAPQFVDKWGSSGSGDSQFSGASGIAVDGLGQVYVADTNNHRIQKFRGDGTFLLTWGSEGPGNGQFEFPQAVTMDASGNVLVADTENNRVQRFTPGGAYLNQWGTTGTGNGQFLEPRAIAVDGAGFIFVTEDAFSSKRVQKFTSAGTYVTKWGSIGSGDGQFQGPRGIAVDDSGYVYVSDTLNNRVQKFTNAGAFVLKWGANGSAAGQFIFPIGMAARDGQIFVVDQNNNRVQQFTRTGTFVSQLGTQCQLFLPGTPGCVDPDGGGPLQLGDGQFSSPSDAVVDRYGFLYVLDTGNSRVEKFGDPLVVGLPGQGVVSGLFRVTPNPFRAQTHIAFHIPDAAAGSPAVVRILDVAGREVRHLWEGSLPSGDYELPWDGRSDAGSLVPVGLYFAALERAGMRPEAIKLVRMP